MANRLILIDTNIFIDHLRKRNQRSSQRLEQLGNDELGRVSVFTIFELLSYRRASRQLDEIEEVLGPFTPIPVNRQIAERAAEIYRSIKQPSSKDTFFRDVLIAASAEYFNLNILTSNIRDFNQMNLRKARVVTVDEPVA